MSRVGLFVTIIIFWVIAVPIINMMGTSISQENDLKEIGQLTGKPVLSQYSTYFYIFDVLFFTLPASIAPPLWVNLFLWSLTLFAIYCIIYLALDVIHGGS